MSAGRPEVRPRWQDYVLVRGERFRTFWASHLAQSERSVLFILGRGFDPRTCLALNLILGAGGKGPRDVIALDYREGPASPSLTHQPLVQQNWAALQSAVQGRGQLTVRPLEFWSPEGRRVSSQNARDLFVAASSFEPYTDVVVGIVSRRSCGS